jgi:hypothetical protein
MAEIVNLRRVKKQRARAEAADLAAENRARHGRTKVEKAAEARETARANSVLDQARIAGPEED